MDSTKILRMQISQGQNLAISSVDTIFSKSYTEVCLKYLNNYLLFKLKQINTSCETQQTPIKSKTNKEKKE